MTRDKCCLCGGSDHHPGACPLRKGKDADPPPDPPKPEPELPDYGYFSCMEAL